MARIVLHTTGSLGDLHPYVAIARSLVGLGHQAVIATHGIYRQRIEAAGVACHGVRPDVTDFGDPAEIMRRANDERDGSRYVVTQLVIPHLRETTEDLIAAVRGADLFVSHMLSLSAPIVCEVTGVHRVHTVLQPMTMFSAYDPPILPTEPVTVWLHGVGPFLWKALWAMARTVSRPWVRPVDVLRQTYGMAPTRAHPVMDLGAGVLNLALFSPVLGPPQPDWPPRTIATGFPFHDRDEDGGGLPPRARPFHRFR